MSLVRFVQIVPLLAACSRPASVEVAPDRVTLEARGATALFAAKVRDAKGAVLLGADVSWSSAAPEVATIDAAGRATAQGPGSAMIVAASGSARGSAILEVRLR